MMTTGIEDDWGRLGTIEDDESEEQFIRSNQSSVLVNSINGAKRSQQHRLIHFAELARLLVT